MRHILTAQLGHMWLGLTSLVLLLALAAPALAADVQQGDSVVVAPDQIVNDDVYAFGSNVQILGTVNGDVFAAGNMVTISGTVTGSVFAAGNTVAISGEVHHALHAAGNTVNVSGPVAGDATLASGNVNMAPGATVGHDVLVAAGTAILAAPVAHSVKASVGDLTLAGPVGGDVQAQVSTLRLTDGAHVQGAMTYTSERDASIASGATPGSTVQHLQPVPRTQPTAGFAGGLIDWVRGLVGLGVIGALFIFLVPRFTLNTLEIARTRFWQSMGIGVAVFIGVPILALLVLILGVIVGGWLLGFAVLALYAIVCAIGAAFAAMATGKLLVQAVRQPLQHLAWNLVEGLALLGLIGLVPFAGGVVLLLACVVGLGAFSLSVVESYRASRTPQLTPITATAGPAEPALAAA